MRALADNAVRYMVYCLVIKLDEPQKLLMLIDQTVKLIGKRYSSFRIYGYEVAVTYSHVKSGLCLQLDTDVLLAMVRIIS